MKRLRVFSQLQPLEAWRHVPPRAAAARVAREAFTFTRRDVRKAAISEEKWLLWQRPGTGQEAFVQAGRHSPCMAWHGVVNACNQLLLVDTCVRIILTPRSQLPLLNCSHLATGCAFRAFPPARVLQHQATSTLHAQAEATRLSHPLQLERTV